MGIDDLEVSSGPDIYYDPDFRAVLDAHYTYLRNLSTNTIRTVTPFQSTKFAGDFYGLLSDMQVPRQFFYVILRINNMVSPNDFTSTMQSILIPDTSVVEMIKNIHLTKKTSL
jgi:hypothetical protein